MARINKLLACAASLVLLQACTNDYDEFSFDGTGATGTGGSTGGSSGKDGGVGGSGGSSATGGNSGTGGVAGGGGTTGGTGGATGGTGGAVGGTGGVTGGTGGVTGGTGGTTGGTGGVTGGTGGTGGVTGGTGGTTGGTGGTTGGTGGATGGTGGVVGFENCLNDIDDNGDGLADCADPQCQAGYTCVTPAPTGWVGVGWVDPQANSACPAPFLPATKLYQVAQLVAPPATCTCGCQAPNGVSCPLSLACTAGAACTTSAATTLTQACTTVAVPAPGAQNSCSVAPPQPTGGSCQAQANALVTPPVWPASARGCLVADGGACTDTTKTCVPRLTGANGPCIARGGNQTCPAGSPYTSKTLYNTGGLNDTRGCSANGCSCGGVAGATCSCTGGNCGVSIHTQNSCGGSVLQNIPATGACTTFTDSGNGDTNWGAQRVGANPSGGTCPPSGTSSATGSATPTESITVCCAP